MERIVLYIPELQIQFQTNEKFRQLFRQLTASPDMPSKVVYVSEKRKLYLHSAAFGELKFSYLTLDFTNNHITFLRMIGKEDTASEIHKILTSLRVAFQIKKRTFLIERPIRQKSNRT